MAPTSQTEPPAPAAETAEPEIPEPEIPEPKVTGPETAAPEAADPRQGSSSPPHGDPLGGHAGRGRQLSVAGVDRPFVEGVYDRLSKVYDWVFGPTLHAGRVQAIRRMDVAPGDEILEVGIGTGITASIYPEYCSVTGIDTSRSMLAKARERVARKGLENVRLRHMDAAELDFPDDTFDIVHAAYVMSVVPDPVRVAKEMERVCKPGGRVVFLNHFKSRNPLLATFDRAISPLTVHIGFKTDLDLDLFLEEAELEPVSVEKVNFPPMWSLVTCVVEG